MTRAPRPGWSREQWTAIAVLALPPAITLTLLLACICTGIVELNP